MRKLRLIPGPNAPQGIPNQSFTLPPFQAPGAPSGPGTPSGIFYQTITGYPNFDSETLVAGVYGLSSDDVCVWSWETTPGSIATLAGDSTNTQQVLVLNFVGGATWVLNCTVNGEALPALAFTH